MNAYYTSKTKSEIAKAAGVQEKTLMRWLRTTPEMVALMKRYHISPHRRKLPPIVVQRICEHFVIFFDEPDINGQL